MFLRCLSYFARNLSYLLTLPFGLDRRPNTLHTVTL
jgi:hypothetical protein